MSHSANSCQSNVAPPSLPLRRKFAFALLSTLTFFLFAEVALRLMGLGRPHVIGVLRFGYDTGIPVYDADGIEREGETFQELPLFVADAELFWRPIPHTPFTGAEGFRLPTPAAKLKEKDTVRVGVIGDSCSFLGEKLYPERLAELVLTETGRSMEVINASCPGYTSFQGVRRLEDLWPWQPDVIVVYFGWNDHWKSLNGGPDRDVMQRQMLSNETQARLSHLRLFQCLRTMYEANWNNKQQDMAASVARVPLDHYRQNLESIRKQSLAHNCPTIFVTAPSAFDEDQMPHWAYDFFGQFYQMSPNEIAAIPATHAQYNDVVRSVATCCENAFLLDVAKHWAEPLEQRQASERFRQDRIHLTESGHLQLAKLLFDAWKQTESMLRNPPQ